MKEDQYRKLSYSNTSGVMMKNAVYTIVLLFLSVMIYSQAPQSFEYNTVIRDSGGRPIQNQTISLQISILEESPDGSVIYSEIHTVETNQDGLVELNIGEGATNDIFSGIEWGINSYYIQIELDDSGGTDFQLMGSVRALSVPYALFANNLAKAPTAAGNYNVMNYGAFNNGTNSEATTKAIRDAVAELLTQKTRKGVLYFPPGRYLVNSQIDIEFKTSLTRAISIQGEGPGISVVTFEASSDNGFNISYIPSGGYEGNKGAIILKDLTIETLNAGAGDAIHLEASNTAPSPHKLIENVTITGGSSGDYWNYGIRLTNCTFTNIRGVQFQGKSTDSDWKGVAILIEGLANPVDNFISNLRVRNAEKAVEIDGRCEGVTIDQSVFLSVIKGVHWHANYLDGHEPFLGINNCHISASEACILTENLMQCQLNNNLFYKHEKSGTDWTGIKITSSVSTPFDFMQIAYNTIHGFDNGTGSREGISLNQVQNSLIKGNILSDVNTGIHLIGVNNSSILDNLFFSSENEILQSGSTGNTIR